MPGSFKGTWLSSAVPAPLAVPLVSPAWALWAEREDLRAFSAQRLEPESSGAGADEGQACLPCNNPSRSSGLWGESLQQRTVVAGLAHQHCSRDPSGWHGREGV